MNIHSNIIHKNLRVGNKSNIHQPMNEWQIVIYEYNKIFLSHKNNKILIWATICLKFGSIMQSEANQSQMATFYMILFIRNVQNLQKYKSTET